MTCTTVLPLGGGSDVKRRRSMSITKSMRVFLGFGRKDDIASARVRRQHLDPTKCLFLWPDEAQLQVISSTSPLNVWQHKGKNLWRQGEDGLGRIETRLRKLASASPSISKSWRCACRRSRKARFPISYTSQTSTDKYNSIILAHNIFWGAKTRLCTLSILTFGSRCPRWQNSQFCPRRQLP